MATPVWFLVWLSNQYGQKPYKNAINRWRIIGVCFSRPAITVGGCPELSVFSDVLFLVLCKITPSYPKYCSCFVAKRVVKKGNHEDKLHESFPVGIIGCNFACDWHGRPAKRGNQHRYWWCELAKMESHPRLLRCTGKNSKKPNASALYGTGCRGFNSESRKFKPLAELDVPSFCPLYPLSN